MIALQYERAKQILTEKAEGHNQLADILLEREIIYADDLEHIFGKRLWVSRSQEILENKKEGSEEALPPSKPVGSGDNVFIDTDMEGQGVTDIAPEPNRVDQPASDKEAVNEINKDNS